MSPFTDGPVRELSLDERFKWGTCPTCAAAHGTYCFAEVGLQLGVRVDGQRMKDGDGAHLSRLKLAPTHVKEVSA